MNNLIKNILAIALFLWFVKVNAQTNFNHFITQIKTNNKSLQAAQHLNTAQKTQSKTGLTPNNPEVEFGYFPGQSSDIGTKQVFGITQSIEFPSTYIYKNKIAGNEQNVADIEFQKTKIQILFSASKAYNIGVFLNRISNNYAKRTADAQKMLDFYIKKQANGDATQLEVNKAKLFLLSIKNQQRLYQSMQKQNNEQIKKLNGGIEYLISDSTYANIMLKPWLEIQSEIDSLLPEFKLFELENQRAYLDLKLNKSARLPELMVGYESENTLGNKYSGIKAGVSIPLWQHKNEIKSAKANIIAQQSNSQDLQLEFTSAFFSIYIEAETLNQNLDEFKTSLNEMNNQYLLARSLELGQISAIEYFLELDYFYGVIDEYFELELKYQLSLTELFKYQLQ